MLDLHTDVENSILSGNGAAQVQVTIPLGTQEGDILFMCATAGCEDSPAFGIDGFTGHSEISTPTGWQLLDQGSAAYAGGTSPDAGAFFAVFWRAIGIGDVVPTTVIIDTGASRSAWSVSIVRVSNVDAPDNNSQVTIGTSANPSTVTVPSVVADADNSLLLYFVGALGVTESEFITPPDGMTHICHMFAQQNAVSQASAIFCEGVAAGATGARSQSISPDGLGRFDPTRPLALMVTVHPGGPICATGKTYFIGTDKGYSA